MTAAREAAWDAVHEALPAFGRVGLLQSLMVLAALAACSVLAPTYDGWTVGALDTCPMPNVDFESGETQPSHWDCGATLAQWLTAAQEAFDRRDPDHAPVLRASLHYNASNKKFLSNPLEVAVFELADGTVRANGVGHFGVDYAHLSTGDYGPDK